MWKFLPKTLFIFFLISCGGKGTHKESQQSGLCENEQNLLSAFDSLPFYKGGLRSLNIDTEQKIAAQFKEDDLCCRILKFNVSYHLNKSDSIKLSIQHYFNCEGCYLPIRMVNNCMILLNAQGQVLFEDKVITLDSLSHYIYDYYAQVGMKPEFPNDYEKVKISTIWDADVSEENFSIFIYQIVSGYLNFVEEKSLNTHSKRICKLNRIEFEELFKTIPFGILIPNIQKVPEPVELNPDLKGVNKSS